MPELGWQNDDGGEREKKEKKKERKEGRKGEEESKAGPGIRPTSVVFIDASRPPMFLSRLLLGRPPLSKAWTLGLSSLGRER